VVAVILANAAGTVSLGLVLMS